jgi:hypothetical protein
MELASYRTSGILDSDVASGFLENLWIPDAGILQNLMLLLFFLTKRRLDGWLEFVGVLSVPTALFR